MSGATDVRHAIARNPLFILLLGVGAAFGVTARFMPALVVGLCVTVVTAGSSLLFSLLRNSLPPGFRLPFVIFVLAVFTAGVDLLLMALVPAVRIVIGIHIPLIAVYSLILGRAGVYAFGRRAGRTVFEASGMGVGFTLLLSAIAGVREVVVFGAIAMTTFSHTGPSAGPAAAGAFEKAPAAIPATSAGALVIVGSLMGLVTAAVFWVRKRNCVGRSNGKKTTEGGFSGKGGLS